MTDADDIGLPATNRWESKGGCNDGRTGQRGASSLIDG